MVTRVIPVPPSSRPVANPAAVPPAPTFLSRNSPRPLENSLTASARRITAKSIERSRGTTAEWQEDAWEMFDLVGELRFLATTLAGRAGKARLYVGQMSKDPTEAPTPVDDPAITAVLDAFGQSVASREQLVTRMGVNLFIAGDGWLCGIPRHLLPVTLLTGPAFHPEVDPEMLPEPGVMSVEDLEWRMLSVSEVTTNSGGQLQLSLGETEAERIICSPTDVYLIRVWRPHPRRWWQADSPTRSSLPVLRELVGLTMHSSAETDSRLAGAGVFLVPQSAQRALQVQAGVENDEDAPDQFTEGLMEAMLAPIQDRSNASAIVPLIVTVPDDSIEKFRFMTFAKELDITAGSRRDEAIRRLALGLDAPPETLLGTGGMNHWGAWLVQEDAVTTHLEPPLALICDALTTQYLWPVLAEQGMEPDRAQQYVIWYDVSELVVRPTRADDAKTLHERGAISDKALRDATGFDDADAPLMDKGLSLAVQAALDLIQRSPSLLTNPGLPQIVAQIQAVLDNEIPQASDPTANPVAPDATAPDTGGSAPAQSGGPSPIQAVPATGPTSEGPPPLPKAAAARPVSLSTRLLHQAAGLVPVGESGVSRSPDGRR